MLGKRTCCLYDVIAFLPEMLSSCACGPLPKGFPGLEKECGAKRGAIQGLVTERQLVVKVIALGLIGECKYRDLAREKRNEKKKSLENRYAEQRKHNEKRIGLPGKKKKKKPAKESLKYKIEERVTVDTEKCLNFFSDKNK